MRHLKKSKKFKEEVNLMSKIEEVFYNISDRYHINFRILDTYQGRSLKVMSILIVASKDDPYDKIIDYNDIKDDLEFAIEYIESELRLGLLKVEIFDEKFISHKDLTEDFKNVKQINLFFRI